MWPVAMDVHRMRSWQPPSVGGRRLDLEHQLWHREPRYPQKGHRRRRIGWPEARSEKIEVLESLVHVGREDAKADDIGEAHIRSLQNGFQIVERKGDLISHIAWILRVAFGIDGRLSGTDELPG